MKIDLKWIASIAGTLVALGTIYTYADDIIFFQSEANAHEAAAASELQSVACASIIAGYAAAVRAQDQPMIAYWKQEAATYQCRLPPI